MQSGMHSGGWVLEYLPNAHERSIDPVMGWTSSKDMMQEVKMTFPNLESAISFADANNMSYEVIEPTARKVIKKSYSDNFV